MKKTLLLCLAAALPASAALGQTSVAIYGVMDVGLVRESGGLAGDITKVTSGVAGGSRLGFRGTEDLGGGLHAIFLAEAGILADTGASAQGGLLFGRQIYVGLQGAGGTVTMGRQYTSAFLTMSMIDPFQAFSMAGSASNLISTSGLRINNTVRYVSPEFGGFSGEVSYGFGEVTASSKIGRQIGASLNYVQGPFAIRMVHGNSNSTPVTPAPMTTGKSTLLGATYDMKPVKLALAYAVNKGAVAVNASVNRDPTADSRDMLLGLTVPSGAHTFRASWISKRDRKATDRDAQQWGVGYNYYISRRTDLYAAYAAINNNAVAGAAGFYTVGNATETGTGDRALNLGIRHTF